MTLFRGKDALLRRIAETERQSESYSLPTFSTPRSDVAAFSFEYGLHPALVRLLMELDRSSWRQVAERLPEGTDTSLLVARWIDWVWSDPISGLRRRVADERLQARGDAICELQRRAAAGEAVSRAQWREARSALAKAGPADEIEAAAAEVIAAAAWDLETAPGAAADMIYAWRAASFAEVDRQLGWNGEKDSAANERWEKASAAGKARADADAADARSSGVEKDEAAAAVRLRQSFQGGIQDYLAANPSELDRRSDLRQAAYVEVDRLAREGLLRQIELLGDPHRATDLTRRGVAASHSQS